MEIEGKRVRIDYVIVMVSDMNRSVAFYRDVIGLPVKYESPGWTEFAVEGATLALHPGVAPDLGSVHPPHALSGQCRPGFKVPDLDEFHRRMIEQGVPCLEEPRDLFGTRVAQYQDPDGLPLSIGQA